MADAEQQQSNQQDQSSQGNQGTNRQPTPDPLPPIGPDVIVIKSGGGGTEQK